MSEPASTRRLLIPLFPLYRLALAWRGFRLHFGLETVRRLRFPVVSIGNLSTGGSGKTPLTIALAKALTARGVRVDVLSRGYGRQSRQTARVHPKGTAAEFGDEPLLIAREAGVPVYVAPQRYEAGLLAEADVEAMATAEAEQKRKEKDKAEAGKAAAENQPVPPGWTAPGWEEAKPAAAAENRPVPAVPPAPLALQPAASATTAASQESATREAPADEANAENSPGKPQLHVHLLDDGFQHRQLGRDIDILMLNRQDWRDWLLPAGNLREPLSAARRASVLAIPANEPELEAELCAWGWQGPIWRLHRKMDVPLAASPIAAFCGIARPKQFFAGLEATGLHVPLRLAFPDHFAYTRDVLEELVAKARAQQVTAVVTTAKDFARMGRLAALFPPSMPLAVAQLRIEIEDESAAAAWLIERLRSSG